MPDPKIGGSYIVDGQISNGEFITHDENNLKWIEVTLPDKILMSKIRFFTSAVSH